MSKTTQWLVCIALASFILSNSLLLAGAGYLAWAFRDEPERIKRILASAESSSKNLENGSKSIAQVGERLNKFITPERLSYIDEAFRAQVNSTNSATEGASGISIATINTIEGYVQPLLDQARKQLVASEALTNELEVQVHSNGEASKTLLIDSDLALLEIKAQLFHLLTNQDIPRLIKGLADDAEEVSVLAKKLSLTAEELRLALVDLDQLIKDVDRGVVSVDEIIDSLRKPESKKAKALRILIQILSAGLPTVLNR
jgi:hypothetical protein